MHILAKVLLLSACTLEPKDLPVPVWSDSVSLEPGIQKIRLFLTADRHDVVALVTDEKTKRLRPLRVSLNNGFEPSVSVEVIGETDSFRYRYTIQNRSDARDPVCYVSIVGPPTMPNTTAAYYGSGGHNHYWYGYVASGVGARQAELKDGIKGRYISWSGASDGQRPDAVFTSLPPGDRKEGFQIDSSLRPGFTTAYFRGHHFVPWQEMVDDGAVWSQFSKVPESYSYKTTITFGPAFLPTDGWDQVIANYLIGIRRLRDCHGLPHTAAFLDEIEEMLSRPHVEANLLTALGQLASKPSTPIERELMSCLTIIAHSFAEDDRKK